MPIVKEIEIVGSKNDKEIRCIDCDCYRDRSEFPNINIRRCKVCTARKIVNDYNHDLSLIKATYKIYGNDCDHCGNNDLRVLEWHHRKGSRGCKIRIYRTIPAYQKRFDDIELLCSNCHIIADLKDGTSARGNKIVLKNYRELPKKPKVIHD